MSSRSCRRRSHLVVTGALCSHDEQVNDPNAERSMVRQVIRAVPILVLAVLMSGFFDSMEPKARLRRA